MTDRDLDKSYTALCEAVTRIGEHRAPLFLAMLALSLIARQDSADQALALIRQAEQGAVQ
ncbi:hypothetical protein ERD78_11320 [Allopusillimonas soli]|uniref:DUF2783 domain-containing protein n=1 Tax=Allopusillimonas soli TaxID=659016 RepID=A0A853FBY3_9BURK|nr:hypothetical protein [Allopusillimonas soli]NYT37457.1 hypothetical protein [Allopusillimonas soli]TEA74562.1 hypothetical protein ERD78_11320 [Allopusillimonas soli]